jgi:ankyrin repeat protein
LLNKEGNAPLHIAALSERSLIIQLLFDNANELGIDLQLKNKGGLTYAQIEQDLVRQKDIEKEQIV